jgi:superfamily I DNA and/or RNA helicase
VALLASEPTGNYTADKVNQNEADMIAATGVRIYELNKDVFDENETVGVIVPYRNQIATVRNTIDRYGIPCLHNITIDTVERYQGSQRKHIIYGFTVSKYYQLDFLTSNVFVDTDGTIIDRKLNVAMTRAEEHLIMIGNPRVLAYSSTFTELIEFTKRHHCYFEIKKDDYVAGRYDLEIERVVGRM